MKLPKLKPELPISGSYYKNGTVTNVFNHCPSKHHPCYPEQCTLKIEQKLFPYGHLALKVHNEFFRVFNVSFSTLHY